MAVALAGLTVFPDPFLRSMGLAGVAVVLVDMLAALTLLPALLALFGKRIKARAPRPVGQGVFARVARVVQRRPAVTALAVLGAMVFIALPVLDMRLSMGDARLLPASSQTRAQYDEMVVHYPDEVRPDPVAAVVAAAPDSGEVAALRDRIADLDGVRSVEVVPIGDITLLDADVRRGAAGRGGPGVRDLPAPSRCSSPGTRPPWSTTGTCSPSGCRGRSVWSRSPRWCCCSCSPVRCCCRSRPCSPTC